MMELSRKKIGYWALFYMAYTLNDTKTLALNRISDRSACCRDKLIITGSPGCIYSLFYFLQLPYIHVHVVTVYKGELMEGLFSLFSVGNPLLASSLPLRQVTPIFDHGLRSMSQVVYLSFPISLFCLVWFLFQGILLFFFLSLRIEGGGGTYPQHGLDELGLFFFAVV